MNQSEFDAVPHKLLKDRENRAYKVRLLWVLHLVGWHAAFKPIAAIKWFSTFDSHLKAALSYICEFPDEICSDKY